MKHKVIALLAAVVLSGCATQQDRDPWEGYNRAVFKFNQVTYDHALIPMAKGYDYVVPDSVQLGIDNAYNNVLEPGRIANDLLQWNLDYVWRDTARFVANTIFGVFGLFDVAKNMNCLARKNSYPINLQLVWLTEFPIETWYICHCGWSNVCRFFGAIANNPYRAWLCACSL